MIERYFENIRAEEVTAMALSPDVLVYKPSIKLPPNTIFAKTKNSIEYFIENEYDELYPDQYLNFHDIVESESAKFYAPPSRGGPDEEIMEVLDREAGVISERYLQGLRKNIPDEYLGLLDNVHVLFYYCYYARFLFVQDIPFWEKILTCLSAGVIPVDWEGEYPEGKLVVLKGVTCQKRVSG